MTNDEKKWAAVVARLHAMTIEGALRWKLSGPYSAPYAVCQPVPGMPQLVRVSVRDDRTPVAISLGSVAWCLPMVDGTDALVRAVTQQIDETPAFAVDFAVTILKMAEKQRAWEASIEGRCHASRGDGECNREKCPQLRDGEPDKSGRHCPLDRHDDDEE